MKENLRVFLEISGMKLGAASNIPELTETLMSSGCQEYTLNVNESNGSICMTLSLRQNMTPETAKSLASFIEKTIANGS